MSHPSVLHVDILKVVHFKVIGNAAVVRAEHLIDALLERTQADELMIVSDMYDPEKRRRSVEIIAEVMRT